VTESTVLVQAMRVLHTCYCCDDADTTIALLADRIGLSAREVSKSIRADGSPLGIERTVETDVALVYDPRGGRVSPAIEVHGWIDPPAVGQPYDDVTRLGIQTLGIAVPSVDDALRRFEASGARLGDRDADDPFALGGTTAVVRAPDGVTFDVTERTDVSDVQFAHLRVTCSDLDTSVAWYRALGWSLVDGPRTVLLDGRGFGLGDISAVFGRRRLPGERFALLLDQWLDPP
jgi:catechol 2,3-dioxygenase-like lactoylglutathione lyase family enzyme